MSDAQAKQDVINLTLEWVEAALDRARQEGYERGQRDQIERDALIAERFTLGRGKGGIATAIRAQEPEHE